MHWLVLVCRVVFLSATRPQASSMAANAVHHNFGALQHVVTFKMLLLPHSV